MTPEKAVPPVPPRRPTLRRRYAGWRDRLRQRPAADFSYRIVVGVVGMIVLVIGIIAIPYPGPGWAIVFVGLGILATEFDWARRALAFVRTRYERVMAWFRSQGLWVQLLGALFTGVVVLGTLWLLGAIGWGAGLIGLDQEWLKSPIGVGS